MGKIRKSQGSQRPPLLNIHIDNHQRALPIRKRAVSKIVKETLLFLNIRCEEVSIYFTTEESISNIHEQFFQDPTPTDCISFPIDDQHLGEIFVCPSVAIAYAKKHNLDPFHETVLYIVHGILHLIGYDDLDPKSKKKMRSMEKKCMEHLKNQKLFLQNTPDPT